jgi:uncharacterized repeat protein (TIGR01451 family)
MPGVTGADGIAGPAGVAPPTMTMLCVTKKADRSSVHQGGLVTWTIFVTNCGELPADGVSVTDRLPKGATFENRGGGSWINGQLVWTTGTLATGASKAYTITTRFSRHARPRTYFNSATADGDNTQPSSGRGSTVIQPPPFTTSPAFGHTG